MRDAGQAPPEGPSGDEFSWEIGSIPTLQNVVPARDTECCCGRASCVYLRHNNEALDGLEKDVQMAARLGQVCVRVHYPFFVPTWRALFLDLWIGWVCCDRS
jgi:hypothetical protein